MSPTVIRQKGDRNKYSVRSPECIGCACLQLGLFQTRGASASGSHVTGQSSACCMWRAYRGCPNKGSDLLVFDKDLAAKRRAEGIRVAR